MEANEEEDGGELWNVETLLKYWSSSSSNDTNNDHVDDKDDGNNNNNNTLHSNPTKKQRVLLICRERIQSTTTTINETTTVQPILKALSKIPPKTSIAFLIGPEGGWSPYEESLFDFYGSSEEKSTNIQCISLGPSILRAETAAITAVGAWSLYCDYVSG
mmetsp:Transcript_31643/g.46508  ORF Transcript_31643/g.46508 Transcript_31643/m.46508 type:complete len:160 (+) Transcript_31643:1-480(+)